MAKLNRIDEPPSSPPKDCILRVPPSAEREFLCLGEEVCGYQTHWDGNRTVACTLPLDECVGHKKSWPTRWKGYVHVICGGTKEEGFVEITPAVYDKLKFGLGDCRHLRGQVFALKRGRGSKARLTLTLGKRVLDMSRYPDGRDPTDTLELLWSYGDKVKIARFDDVDDRADSI